MNFKKIDEKQNFKDYFIEKDNLLVLKKNSTIIDKDIYIPKNLNVKIYPGQKIILKDKALIFSSSPWLVGEKNNYPVYIGGLEDNFGVEAL